MIMKMGAWVAQSMKHPTLELYSRHDLEVMRLSPTSAPHWAWSLLEILSPSPSAPSSQPQL